MESNMSSMTLQDYIKLAESATDGPWEAFYEGSGDFALYQISNGKQDVARIWANQDEEIVTVSGPDSCMFGGQQSDRNAQFIAASRTLGPAMAKALIEADEVIERLIRACDDHGVSETYTDKAEGFLTKLQALNGEHA